MQPATINDAIRDMLADLAARKAGGAHLAHDTDKRLALRAVIALAEHQPSNADRLLGVIERVLDKPTLPGPQ